MQNGKKDSTNYCNGWMPDPPFGAPDFANCVANSRRHEHEQISHRPSDVNIPFTPSISVSFVAAR